MIMETKVTLKILYVLVCSNRDYYFEQFLLSVTSLRRNMTNIEVMVLIDDKTRSYLNERKELWGNFVDKLIAVPFPSGLSGKQRSRWLKTSMRQHIEGDFLYIDCDTVIADDLSGISDFDGDIGAVLDYHCLKKLSLERQLHYRSHFEKTDKTVGFHLSSPEWDSLFNSGVIFCRDTEPSRLFFEEWHRLWNLSVSHGIMTDQQSFYEANYRQNGIVKELDGKWNCQVIVAGAVKYLATASIIHYYNVEWDDWRHTYLLADNEIFEQIRRHGITEGIQMLLAEPRNAFCDHAAIVDFPQIDRRNIDNICTRDLCRIVLKRIFRKIGFLRKDEAGQYG